MWSKIRLYILLLLVGVAIGLALPYVGKKTNVASPIQGEISECFEPQEECTRFVVDAIKLARSEILVQAYGYTNKEILAALSQAKKDGIDVRVILDKTNESERYPAGTCNAIAGIPVLIDHKVKIAHNKVMIIDRKHVIEGSFNFTESAEKNAENVNLIKDNPRTAARYLENWNARAAKSRPIKQQNVAC